MCWCHLSQQETMTALLRILYIEPSARLINCLARKNTENTSLCNILRGPPPPSPFTLLRAMLPHRFCRQGFFHTAEVHPAGTSTDTHAPQQTHSLALHLLQIMFTQTTCSEQTPGIKSFARDQLSISFTVKKRKQNMGNPVQP